MSTAAIRRASSSTFGELLSAQARRRPHHPAIVDGPLTLDYKTLESRVNRLAHALTKAGVTRGARVAMLSENRHEYLEATFAAAKIGAILCALNWRIGKDELAHCINMVAPALVIASERFGESLEAASWGGLSVSLGQAYESLLASESEAPPSAEVDPEDGLLIIYTSGTTGLPKGAVISHRAELARMNVSRLDLDMDEDDAFVAWLPMYHMAALEQSMHLLGMGGKVITVDGPDVSRIVDLAGSERHWWLALLPGMIERVVEEARRRGIRPGTIKRVGALADLVPLQTIAETSRIFNAPYWNTFGSTEAGMLPVAGTTFPVGEEPRSLAKAHNSLYAWRLVDADGRDVPVGTPGEIILRGPTIFSGYWNAEEVNARDFRDGYFHTGDMFSEQPDGKLLFVDRSKYLIKSGGENIYPIEIERVLMAYARVVEAVVVRKRDAKWGEVPVAFVVVSGEAGAVSVEDLVAICRGGLSSYKCPREIRLVASQEKFPRSSTGKVQRHVVEEWLETT